MQQILEQYSLPQPEVSRDPTHWTNTMVWGCLPSEGRSSVPLVGPGGVGQPLKLQRGDDVLGLGIGKFVEFIQVDGVIAGGYDDGAVLFAR